VSAKQQPKLRLRYVPGGVDLIDRDGSWLAGMTEEDAIELHSLLQRNLVRLHKRIGIRVPRRALQRGEGK